jgi:glycine/D-amino acid oxidase-like deaminating enzyme
MDIETDVLIVGGGIAGCSAAYYLARDGVEVALVDRGEVGRGATGRNAGSLHQQLMPFTFREGSARERQARVSTLPLMVAAAGVWQELSRELDGDIELRIVGGLMVAESDEHMAFLADKVALERDQGLDVHMVSGNELRTLAPYLSEAVIGAEYAPGEGKLNSLRAIAGLVKGAKQGGARLFQGRELLDLEHGAGGFTARVTGGRVRCQRVVNAAGPWSAQVAAKVGISLPVEPNCVQSGVTERTAPLVSHLVCHAEKILSLKQVANGGLIIGGGWPARIDPVTNGLTVLAENVRANVALACQMVPGLEKVRLLRSWAGVNIKSDGKPILGEVPGVPGFYNVVPPDAGLTMGPICARLVVEQMTGRRPSMDIGIFSV